MVHPKLNIGETIKLTSFFEEIRHNKYYTSECYGDELICEFERHKIAKAVWIALKAKFGDGFTNELIRLTNKFDTYKFKPNAHKK